MKAKGNIIFIRKYGSGETQNLFKCTTWAETKLDATQIKIKAVNVLLNFFIDTAWSTFKGRLTYLIFSTSLGHSISFQHPST
jgi:hypothetical protein